MPDRVRDGIVYALRYLTGGVGVFVQQVKHFG